MYIVSEQLNPQSPDENRRNGAERKVDETATSVSSTEKSLVQNLLFESLCLKSSKLSCVDVKVNIRSSGKLNDSIASCSISISSSIFCRALACDQETDRDRPSLIACVDR